MGNVLSAEAERISWFFFTPFFLPLPEQFFFGEDCPEERVRIFLFIKKKKKHVSSGTEQQGCLKM
jgi:hypothetical protein